ASFDHTLRARVMTTIVTPTITALADEGAPYSGVLFVQLMLTADGPKVVEFNCRFGDPECQAILAPMDADLLPLLAAVARGERAYQAVDRIRFDGMHFRRDIGRRKPVAA